MGSNYQVKVALMLLVLCFTTIIIDAHDRSEFINQVLANNNGDGVKLKSKACCDACYCTKSIPPQCRCADVGETCHAACKSCACKESLPLQCRCVDVNEFCYGACHCPQAK
ncbi:Proteinase inhibitor I12, Bowman-Birk [Sesbania bispinosa]|nr:Proteinase inhibitor I12, Bowman-Birk [Sesbania bispinosa]